MNDLLAYYDKIIPSLSWKILQKEKKNSTNMILAEGIGKTSLSVIISESAHGRLIKLFYKKPSLFD